MSSENESVSTEAKPTHIDELSALRLHNLMLRMDKVKREAEDGLRVLLAEYEKQLGEIRARFKLSDEAIDLPDGKINWKA